VHPPQLVPAPNRAALGIVPSQELQSCLASDVAGGYNANNAGCDDDFSDSPPAEDGSFWCDYCTENASSSSSDAGMIVGLTLGLLFLLLCVLYFVWKEFFFTKEDKNVSEEKGNEGSPNSIFDFREQLEGSDTSKKVRFADEGTNLNDGEEVVELSLPAHARNFREPQPDLMYVPKKKKKHYQKEIDWDKEFDEMNEVKLFKKKVPETDSEVTIAKHAKFRLKPRRNLPLNMFMKGTRQGNLRPDLQWE